jgi:hypothetical protein
MASANSVLLGLTVSCLAMAGIVTPGLAQETLVGEWALSRQACNDDIGRVLIEPKAVVYGEDTRCVFEAVSRRGDTVRWTNGICMRGADDTPTDRDVSAIATLKQKRLRLVVSNAGPMVAVTLVRCPSTR